MVKFKMLKGTYVNDINQGAYQKAVSFCLYVRTITVAYKSAYSDQCACVIL